MFRQIVLSDGTKLFAEAKNHYIEVTIEHTDGKTSVTSLQEADNIDNVAEQNLDYFMDAYIDQELVSYTEADEKLIRKTMRPFVERVSARN